VSDPGLDGGEEIAADAALQQHVRHQQEQRHGDQHETVGGRQQALRHHQRREAADREQAEAEAGQREGDRDAGEKKRKERRENEQGCHVGGLSDRRAAARRCRRR
jgi:hypothetical protein